MTNTFPVDQLELLVHGAVASVDDPEYPGISIVDLGLLERLEISGNGDVSIGLIPTFSGCPALALIAEDVRSAVADLAEVTSVTVDWLSGPNWTVDRISAEARAAIGRDFTVGIQIGSKPAPCPLCGEPTREVSMFGPSRCRSVHRCDRCAETVEVMRT